MDSPKTEWLRQLIAGKGIEIMTKDKIGEDRQKTGDLIGRVTYQVIYAAIAECGAEERCVHW